MKQYYGNYLGIVITGGEKDPEGRGRCQVFVPHIMPALYEGWNKEGQDLSFDIIGDGLPTSLDPGIVDKLKRLLPWAECAAPIVGASPSTKDGSEETRNVALRAGAFGPPPGAFGDSFGGASDAEAVKNTFAARYGGDITSGYCGKDAKDVLIKLFDYPTDISGADGKGWAKKLEGLGWKKVSNNPADVTPLSMGVWGSGPHGHVATGVRLGDGRTGWVGGSLGVTTPDSDKFFRGGGSKLNADPNSFLGVWEPPPDRLNIARGKLGQSPINPSAVTGNTDKNMVQPPEEQNNFSNSKGEKFVATGTGSNGGVRLNYEGTNLAFKRSGRGVGQSTTSFRFKNGSYLDGNSDLFVVAPVTDSAGNGIPDLVNRYPLGSKVVVTNPVTNKTAVGIIGDYGAQSRGWGEVSAATARAVGIKENISRSGLGTVGDSPDQAKLEITVLPEVVAKNGQATREDYKNFISQNNTQDALASAKSTVDTIPAEVAAVTNSPSIRNTTQHARNDGPDTNYQALGMFGYASEGTTVWLFFREGDPHFPVYFAASYGQKEWANMYGYASPGIGSGAGGADPGTEKMRLNSYGGGFESAQVTGGTSSGLDPQFTFQVYGKNGSNLLFTKDHTEFNSTYNHNQRVSGDFHEITEANKETRVRGDKNTFVEQDVYETIGNWSDEAIAASDEIQQYINEAMEIKSKAGQSTA